MICVHCGGQSPPESAVGRDGATTYLDLARWYAFHACVADTATRTNEDHVAEQARAMSARAEPGA